MDSLDIRPARARRWSTSLPHEPGFYEFWDPASGVNRIAQVVVDGLGRLVVRLSPDGMRDVPLFCFTLGRPRSIAWTGPISVPDAVGWA